MIHTISQPSVQVGFSGWKGDAVVTEIHDKRVIEHPCSFEFVEQQRTLGGEGAELYTVLQINDDVDRVKSFFLNRGGDWPIVRDDDGTTNVDFGVALVPETFIIDPNGVVVVRWAGQIDAETLGRLVQQQRDLYELS